MPACCGMAVFSKINLCALSIRKLLPDSGVVPGAEFHGIEVHRRMFCDVSSAASLCRNLVEASNRLYYLAIEPVSETEAAMRLAISNFHAVSGQIYILRHLGMQGEALEDLKSERAQIRVSLESFSEFQKLDKRVKDAIFAGRRGEHLSQAEIAERRGRNIAAFKADYKYLSSHIHSDAFSLVDLSIGKAGGLMTEATRQRFIGIMRHATNYVALSVRDMNGLFPQFRMTKEGSERIGDYSQRLQ